MPPTAKYFTEEGLKNLKEELRKLKTEKRKDIAIRLEHAKSLGDLSENAEYQETKEEQSMVESQIAELEETIRNAVIIKKNNDSDSVEVGSTVKVKTLAGEKEFNIVGSKEANPAEGKISNESPLGKAFLGRKTGEKIEVKTLKGIVTYKILEIK